MRQRKVESNQIEFKNGWNPDRIFRSICAFANDFDNIGVGYILVRIEEENMRELSHNGFPVASYETDEDRLAFHVCVPCTKVKKVCLPLFGLPKLTTKKRIIATKKTTKKMRITTKNYDKEISPIYNLS